VGVGSNSTEEEKNTKMEQLEELLIAELKDLYSAEKQIVRALPKLVKGAASPELKQAFTEHLEVTREQVSRLEQVFEQAGQKPKAKPCKGMEGLLTEGSEHLEEEDAGVLRDLALIAACQRVEHYEVAAYGSARTMAEKLAMGEAVQLLQQTLNEEEEADKKLTQVAEVLYGQVMSEAQDEEDEASDDEDSEDLDEEDTEDEDTEDEPTPARRAPAAKGASKKAPAKKAASKRR